MYKNVVSLLLLVIPMKCFSWGMIYIYINDQSVAAWIPQSQLELDVAQQANAQLISYSSGQYILGFAYIFPNENGIPQNHPPTLQFGCRNSIIHPNAFDSGGGLLTLAPSINSGIPAEESGWLRFNKHIEKQVKYCKEFAYRQAGCQRSTCDHIHIKVNDLKTRVVCFRQIMGSCHSIDCSHRHLLPHQLWQLQYARQSGDLVPIIICAEHHETSQEEENCPYLHFNSH